MLPHQHREIFLDTNMYLHYLFFDQVDWCKSLVAKTVTIHVSAVIVRELDKHKDEHPVKRIRKRAANICRKLFDLYDQGVIEVRPGVSVRLDPFEPQIDFGVHRLSSARGDDCLLASAIELRQQSGAEVVIVTNDTGLLLKAAHYRIATWRPPEELKLPEEDDVEEKRLKEMERQLKESRGAVAPRLSLRFVGGEDHAAYTLPLPEPTQSFKFMIQSVKLREQYPKALPPEQVITLADRQRLKEAASKLDNGEELAETIITFGEMLRQIHPLDVEHYNNALEQFYTAYEEYWKQSVEYDNMWRRTLKVEVYLVNDGTCPAEDVDIILEFPEGLILRAEDDAPLPPSPPSPPQPPQSLGGRAFNYLAKKLRGITSPAALTALPAPESLQLSAAAQLNPVFMISPDRHKVKFEVPKLKHALQTSPISFHAIFDSYEAANSFTLPYWILAANVPRPVTGCLNVRIDKSNPPTSVIRPRRRGAT